MRGHAPRSASPRPSPLPTLSPRDARATSALSPTDSQPSRRPRLLPLCSALRTDSDAPATGADVSRFDWPGSGPECQGGKSWRPRDVGAFLERVTSFQQFKNKLCAPGRSRARNPDESGWTPPCSDPHAGERRIPGQGTTSSSSTATIGAHTCRTPSRPSSTRGTRRTRASFASSA